MPRAVVRSTLTPGQLFGFVPGGETLCVALEPASCQWLDLPEKLAGKVIFWHVYLPAGQLSWAWENTLVYLPDEERWTVTRLA